LPACAHAVRATQVAGDGARVAQEKEEGLLGVLEGDDMFGLVFGLAEVQVVDYGVFLTGGIGEDDGEFEFAPAVFRDAEGWLFED